MNGNIMARFGWWMLFGRILASVESVTLSNVTTHPAHREQGNLAHTEHWLSCPARNWREAHSEIFDLPICLEPRWGKYLLDKEPIYPGAGNNSFSTTLEAAVIESSTTVQHASPTPLVESAGDPELDTESPLDNANFLSFEDWKKQNLAKIGQSADNVGGRRPGAAETVRENRRRAGTINNALDSLGDDSEIELDFGGFGAEAPDSNAAPGSWAGSGGTASVETSQMDGEALVDEERAGSVAVGKRQDAGTTCKERFNYASFDCAATVLKTNPQCTGSSSVLIENKDSYMLNECRAENKFLILELCDDILIDTVVLANYEFFSSIFRTFRVSVSDRYPVKLDKWKELGVFEARNTREVQAFAIENPLIWARYVKVEFLTHYGNEFYCPVSLVRIHGTTMMEEYKNDGEPSRSDDDGLTDAAVETAEQPVAVEDVQTSDSTAISSENATDPIPPEILREFATSSSATAFENPLLSPALAGETCHISEAPPMQETAQPIYTQPVASSSQTINFTAPASGNVSNTAVNTPISEESSNSTEHVTSDGPTSSTLSPEPQTVSEWPSPADSESRPAMTNVKEESSVASEPTKPTSVQPPSPNPTTQESFFKSVNKRLQMLESNSSLSLLYIEEQSRILREAFNKVEKRQLSKTTTFLENLNTTVLTELREFRSQYDQIWRSVAIEFESQRFEYHQELHSVTAQLAVLADELVFQKRVSVIQSIFVLVCFGLVLFSRNSVGNYIDLPSVQSMVARGYSLRPSSPIFGTPTVTRSKSSPSYQAKRGHQRQPSDDSQDGIVSPTISYSPPTPSSESGGPASPSEDSDGKASPISSRLPTPDLLPQTRPGSSPAMLHGSDKAIEEVGVTTTAYLETPGVTPSPAG